MRAWAPRSPDSPPPPARGPAAWLVLAAGNALIIAIEGMVVGIQTTRLVLFEFFIRFLQGSGRAFHPLASPPAAPVPHSTIEEIIMKHTTRIAVLWAGAVAVLRGGRRRRSDRAAAGGAGSGGGRPPLPRKRDPQLMGWAFLGAALSTGLAALAAGYAVARVGSAAVGAVAEKPELFGRVLVLVGLAEGIAIYGLIVSILILNRIA